MNYRPIAAGLIALSCWASALAADLRISGIVREADGGVRISLNANANSYYLLLRGGRLEDIATPRAAALGTAGQADLRDSAPAAAATFLRVKEVPIDAPLDSDGDGIDDVYELQHPGELNALDPADADRLAPGGGGRTWREIYAQASGVLTVISDTSPAHNESGVAVTRETVLRFSQPLAVTTTLGLGQLQVAFGGRTLLSRVELSSDRTKATLFYLENLPASARIRVTFNAAGVKDMNGRELDADGDGQPGGTAKIDFDTLSTTPVGETAVVGRVFDSAPMPDGAGGTTNRPLAGVTISVDGAEQTLRTTTDADGYFKLQPVPAGRFFVHVDGRTSPDSNWPEGAYFPFVGKAWEAVAGRTNLANTTGTIFLPLVPAGALQVVSATEVTAIGFTPEILTANPALAGVKILIPPNALFDDNGTRGGRVGIAPVPPDRLPEPLPPGLNFPLVITIQTDGPRNFDRPVPVRFPNLPDPVTGQTKAPGEKSALWSFDHDTGEWAVVGPMTVTADGLYVETDPGVGVLQPGWHGTQSGAQGNGTLGEADGDQVGLMKNVFGNIVQSGWSLLGTIGDLGNIPGLGKLTSAVNLVVDTASFFNMPSLLGFAKIALDVGGLVAPPGVDVVVRGASTLLNVVETANNLGSVVQSAQQSNQNFDDIYGQASPNPQRSRRRPAATGGFAVAPPQTLYRAQDYFDRSGQRDKLNELTAHFVATTNLLLRTIGPQYTEMDRLLGRMAPLATRFQTDPNAIATEAEQADFLADAVALNNVIAGINVTARPDDLLREFYFRVAAYQRVLYENLAMGAVGETFGPLIADGRKVLLGAFRQRGVNHSVYYRLRGPGLDLRRQSSESGQLRFIVRPDEAYQLTVLDPQTLKLAVIYLRSGSNGQLFELPPLLAAPDPSPDLDGDGLGELSEIVMGTSPTRADSDGDGVSDGAEIQGGTNPLDNIPTEIGIIGATALPPGTAAALAVDVCAVGSRAFLALDGAGLAILEVAQPSQPVIVAQVDTPGTARRVACDGNFAAVADGTTGLAIVDITDPPAAFVSSQVPVGNALSVVTADGVAYVGTAEGDIVWVHLPTGTELGRISLGAPVHDLAWQGTILFVQTASSLNSLRREDDELTLLGTLPVPLFAEGITGRRRLAVGNDVAYVTSYPGYTTINVSNPMEMSLIAPAVDAGPNSFKQIVPTGSGLGVAAVGVNPRDDGTHDVELYDLKDPTLTTGFLARIPTPGLTYAVALHRGLAYVADGAEGFEVLNFLATDTGTTAPTANLGASFDLNPAQAEGGSFAALHAEARDDVLVRETEFYLDGTLVETDGNYPFEHRFRVPKLTAEKTTFTIQARAIDTGGNATVTPVITVQILPDLTPPKARPAEPLASGFGANVTQVTAIFSEPILESTLNPASFTLVGAGPDRTFATADDVVVSGAVSLVAEARTAVFNVDEPLPAGRYQARLTRAITDLTGNALAAEALWNFEAVLGTDTDGDGLTDEFELANGLDPLKADQNNNGITDSAEDFDGDGLSNGVEMLLGTNPRNQRSFDGVLDGQLDRDSDFLPDAQELRYGTDRLKPDTDGDAWNDEIEITTGSNPLVPNAYLPGLFVSRNFGQALRPTGPSFRTSQADVLRLGDGQVMQSTSTANVLRQGGPNANGHTVNSAAPVRLRQFDLEAADLAPGELPIAGALVIEAEDYNFESGQQLAAASVMPYLGGAYAGRAATLGVDYFNTDDNNSDLYRPDTAPNNVNLVPNLGGLYALDRPGWRVTSNYREGWSQFGDWQQYTRALPAGDYWIWAALSHGGVSPGQLSGSLDLVTGDASQPNPALTQLGTFSGQGTGAYGNNRLVLLRDGTTAPYVLHVEAGTTTFRFNLGSGDFDWFVLIPTNSAPQ